MNVILYWLFDILRRLVRTLDGWLCVALLALMVIGLAVLYSAGNESPRLVLAQGSRFALGFVAMWGLSRLPPHQLRHWTPLLYGLSVVPLLVVLAIGQGKHGNLWINLGVFYFQPAEVLKLTLPMMAAWYLNREILPPRFRVVLIAGVIIGVPTGLILLQPDFGTAMLVGISGAFVLFLAGLSWWWFATAAGGIAAIAPVAWFWLLRPYQKDRILTFLDPNPIRSAPAGTSSSPRSRSARAAGRGWAGATVGGPGATACPAPSPCRASRRNRPRSSIG